jgi:hypothetical protein
MLALALPSVWPSVLVDDVGTPISFISQLNTLPACAPVNASRPASRLDTHDSGSGWFATPFLCDSSIHDSTPVYPGAPTEHVSLRRTHSFAKTRSGSQPASILGYTTLLNNVNAARLTC